MMQGHVPKIGPVWKASSSLFTLQIPASVGEWREAKGVKVGEDQSMLRTGEPKPKNTSSVHPWLSRCPRTGLSIGARLLVPALDCRENPIQSIFGGSELSFPLLPHEKKQTPASHPRYCSWKDGFSSRKQALICISAG